MDELAQQSSERLPQGIPPVETAIVQCSFCRGSGKDPFGIMSYLSNCCVCAGKRVVRVTAPYRPCPHCRGTGAVKRLTCTVCRGTGYVPQTAGPSVVCPECRGTGDDTGAPAMACLACHGLGLVPVGPTPAELRARAERRLAAAAEEAETPPAAGDPLTPGDSEKSPGY